MLGSIKHFFNNHLASNSTEHDKQVQQQLKLAVAALLIEVMHADNHVDPTEIQHVATLLENHFDLTPFQLNQLIELAKSEVHQSNDLFQFTKLINEHTDYDERVMLIQYLWEIAYVDGNVDKYEDYFIRKIADLIYVQHSDFIKAKLTTEKNLLLKKT